jgi:hypothetical protein
MSRGTTATSICSHELRRVTLVSCSYYVRIRRLNATFE